MEVPYEADEGDINVTHHVCDACKHSEVYWEHISILSKYLFNSLKKVLRAE
jgi:hypothetical protein